MIGVDTKALIRKLYFVEGKSIRAISRMLKVARKTVRRALLDAEPPKYHLTKERPKRVIGSFLPIIHQWLEEDQHRPPKQRHTAKRIYERLKEEYGYQGSEETVRRYVRLWRQNQPREMFLPMDFGLEGWAQADWFEVYVEYQGKLVKVHIFVMRLCGSKAIFARAYWRENAEATLDAHVRAFEFWGGVPPRIVYDNPKTLVAKIFSGRRRKKSERFYQLQLHYLFTPEFCLPYEAHEKGLVENAVRLIRNNFFVPVPKLQSLEEINEKLEQWCRKYMEQYLPEKEATVGELFAQEKLSFIQLPQVPFEPAISHSVKASHQALVCFDGNRYSVPVDKAHLPLTLKAFVDHIEIYHEGEKIAVHERYYEKREKPITHYTHYLPLLARKPNYVWYTLPYKQLRLPAPLEQFINRLTAISPQPQRDVVALLELVAERGIEEVAAAAEEALLAGVTSVSALLAFLPHPDTEAPVPADLAACRVHMPHPAIYNRLLAASGGGGVL